MISNSICDTACVLHSCQVPQFDSSPVHRFSSSPFHAPSIIKQNENLLPLPINNKCWSRCQQLCKCACACACVCVCVCKCCCACACTQRKHYIYITLCNSISYSFFTASAMNFYVQQRKKNGETRKQNHFVLLTHSTHSAGKKWAPFRHIDVWGNKYGRTKQVMEQKV